MSSQFSLISLLWPPKILPPTPQINPEWSSPIHSLIKLESTLKSSNFWNDLVSLTVLFIHWQTMGELVINPCYHSHYSSANAFEFFLPFFSDTLSSGLLFCGHTTPLKKNIKGFVERLFLTDIKNILRQQMLTGLLPWMLPTSRTFTAIRVSNHYFLFLILLVTATHPSFELCKIYSQCSVFSNYWLL